MFLPPPQWLEAIEDKEEQSVARTKFFLRLAALYHSESGDLCRLSEAIGLHKNSLGSTSYSKLPNRTVIAIEKLIGENLDFLKLYSDACGA